MNKQLCASTGEFILDGSPTIAALNIMLQGKQSSCLSVKIILRYYLGKTVVFMMIAGVHVIKVLLF